MPERRSLLVFPESVDIDIFPYSLLGRAFDDIKAYWDRWKQPLLERGKSVGVFISIPHHYLEATKLREAWEEEKAILRRVFRRMSRLGLEVDGVHDLSGRSAEEAREAVRNLMLEHKQVIGIAHVEAYRDVPLDIDETALRDVETEGGTPLGIEYVLRTPERERPLYRESLEGRSVEQWLKESQFLFSIQWSRFQDDLDSLPVGGLPIPVPDSLRGEFERQGSPLSADAAIRRTQANEWRITDQGKTCIIQRDNQRNKLNIYEPCLTLRIRLSAPYFKVGRGGALDRNFFLEVARELGVDDTDLISPHLRGRAIFVGCSTAPTGLAQELVKSGIAIVGLGTPRPIRLTLALALLRAVLIAGYQPAKQAIGDIVTITAKLLGFPQYGSTPSFLVTKSSVGFPNGEDAFYWVYRTSSLSLPELEPITKEEVKERLKKAPNYGDWMIVDVPPEIRGEMAEALRGKPVLWPARGASCASVAAPFSALEPENVIYQLGYVGKAPRGLVFRLLSEFTCLSVQNFANSRVSNILPFDHEIELPALLNQLKRLCRSGATLVVAAAERAVLGE